MKSTESKCRNPECEKPYFKFKTTDKYCSFECSRKCEKPPKLKLTPLNKSKQKRIPKISQKRQIENAKYSVLRIEFLGKKENSICPITKQPTTDIHHMKGRVGSLFLDTKYWVALSREGHKFVEENPIWAKENGYSLNRLSNE